MPPKAIRYFKVKKANNWRTTTYRQDEAVFVRVPKATELLKRKGQETNYTLDVLHTSIQLLMHVNWDFLLVCIQDKAKPTSDNHNGLLLHKLHNVFCQAFE